MPNRINPHEYNITIKYDGVTKMFTAKVLELPDVCEYGDHPMEVYELALDTIRVTAEMFSDKGRPMPKPLRNY